MINDIPQKNYYAVITADILYHKGLTPRQKLLVASISNLSNEKGYCWATNSYFSEMLNCEERTIQRDLKVLEDLGILGRVIQLDSNGQFKMRTLTIIDHAPSMTGGGVNSDIRGGVKNDAHNNKDINNKEEYILSDFEIFEQFWNAYDRKEGRKRAEQEWKKLSEQDKKIALAHAQKYSAAREQKFRKSPAKYLADREFENEVIIGSAKKEQSTFLSKEQTEKQKAFENNWNWALKNFKYDPDAPYKTFGSKSDCMKFFEANGGTYSLEKHNYYMQNSVRP